MISAVTVLVLLAGAEIMARVVWPEQVVNACRTADPVLGFRYRANCRSVTKTVEGPWVTNDYNDCGYRSATPCGAVPPGTRRLATIGTSLSEGHMVEYANTIAARVGVDLAGMCGAPVDVQNLAAIGYSGQRLVPRMEEALRLRPAEVLLVLSPFDLEGELGEDAAATGVPADAPAAGLQRRVFEQIKASRAVVVAQHFLFQNPSIYLPLYLRYGDKADFLRPPFSSKWQQRLRVFEGLLTQLAGQAQAAGVPFMFAFVPQEAQVALMARGANPDGVEPGALPRALEAIALRHGVAFADTSVALRTEAAPERLYYQVDGHLSGRGQPIAAGYIAERLAAASGGPFSTCHRSRSASLDARP